MIKKTLAVIVLLAGVGYLLNIVGLMSDVTLRDAYLPTVAVGPMLLVSLIAAWGLMDHTEDPRHPRKSDPMGPGARVAETSAGKRTGTVVTGPDARTGGLFVVLVRWDSGETDEAITAFVKLIPPKPD